MRTNDRPPIRFYNTLTRRKEPLTPITDGRVNLFVCGPTVYDLAHLGHAKTYTQFDLLVRVLRSWGYEVFYLQNITDIDDKIIDRARRDGVPWRELAARFETAYREDMAALHNTQVTQYARATEYMSAIVRQVESLLARGHAYRATDGIYFENATFPDYGKLSGRTELQAADAVSRVDDGAGKRGSGDFCLWKAQKPDEPSWETSLGPGRPGWHIEDTAITETFFGPQYDLHGGAVDLIFPHHEAEIAQMEAASGRAPLVRYWLHTGFLNSNAEKMSKSLGNFTTIRSTLVRYSYQILRYLFLSSHYRSALDFTPAVLEQASGAVRRLEEFLFSSDPGLDDVEAADAVAELRQRIDAALSDDLDTPSAFAALFEFVRHRNAEGRNGRRVHTALRELDALFEILPAPAETTNDAGIEELVARRQACRARRDYRGADVLRDELLARGVQIYDGKDGSVRWRRLSTTSDPLSAEQAR